MVVWIVIFVQVNVHVEKISAVERAIVVRQAITIIHVVLNAIVMQPVHSSQSVIRTQALVYAKKMSMDHDVIVVLTVHLLYYLIILKVARAVTVLVRQHNVIRVCSIIVRFVICPIGL